MGPRLVGEASGPLKGETCNLEYLSDIHRVPVRLKHLLRRGRNCPELPFHEIRWEKWDVPLQQSGGCQKQLSGSFAYGSCKLDYGISHTRLLVVFRELQDYWVLPSNLPRRAGTTKCVELAAGNTSDPPLTTAKTKTLHIHPRDIEHAEIMVRRTWEPWEPTGLLRQRSERGKQHGDVDHASLGPKEAPLAYFVSRVVTDQSVNTQAGTITALVRLPVNMQDVYAYLVLKSARFARGRCACQTARCLLLNTRP